MGSAKAGEDFSSTIVPEVTAETLSDMAKHLRQINFYFLLACAALLIAVFLPRDTTLDKATVQLGEVIRFQSEVGDQPLWKIAGTAPPEWVGAREPTVAILFRRPSDLDGKLNVCFVFENEILPGAWQVLEKDDFRQVTTHQEFAELWETLAADDAFLRIRKYSPAGYHSTGNEGGMDLSSEIPVQVVASPEDVKQIYTEAFSAAGSEKYIPTFAKWVDAEATIARAEYSQGIQLAKSTQMLGGEPAIILPVAVEPARLPILNRLLGHAETEFQYLAANHYGLVHRELFDWTLGGELDQLNLYALQSSLNEFRIAQGEKFNVFGFGIPYEFLFQYGLLILVVMAVFFWGHLRSFRILAAGKRNQLWAAWLPLYPNRLSRFLTLVSGVLFPVSVMVQLLWAAEFSTLSLLTAAAGVGVACMICAEFYRYWRDSPQAERSTELTTYNAAA